MSRIDDWQTLILEMVRAKQELAAWDPEGVFPHRFPGPATTDEAVAAVEKSLGVYLDAAHAEFLGLADGWEGFHQSVTLYSAAELVGGTLRDAAHQALQGAPEAFADLERSPADVLVIASSLAQTDVFLMPIDDGYVGEEVHWLAEGRVVDTFDSFEDFVRRMIEITKRQAVALRDRAEGTGFPD